MEKLKAKHDHLFTKLLKVGIFALVLLLPFFVFMPTAFYYGFNEHAVTAQGERNQITIKQGIMNGKPNGNTLNVETNADSISYQNDSIFIVSNNATFDVNYISDLNVDLNDLIYFSFDIFADTTDTFNVNLYFGTSSEDDIWEFDFVSQDFVSYKYIYEMQNNSGVLDSFSIYSEGDNTAETYIKSVQLFNLTTIFGSGNEPTADEFATFIGENYYEYGQEYTYTLDSNWSITDNMSLAWETTWKTPLFNWTENTPFKASINGFTSIFNISQESGIDNLLAYIMTISCIYVVIDIVLGLFTWITHTIGER